jgi:ubiquinol-cytochrome c reductase cytochrome c subunit
MLVGFSGAPPAAPSSSGADGLVFAVAAPADGQELYLSTCATCHGPDGRGTINGPSLVDAGPASIDFYLRTGRMPLSAPGDPQWRQEPVFTQPQIDAIVQHASRLGTGPQIPQVTTAGADLRLGWERFINDCAACHGPSGSGGSVGAGVFAPSLGRADPRTVAEAVLIGPGAMPKFAYAQEEIDAVAAYVEYLRTEPSPGGISLGGTGPVPEGFVAIVVGLGLIVLVTRWIGRRTEA